MGRRARPPAGRDVHCRRDRDAGRRSRLHAAGADGVLVGSGIFKSADPPAVAKAIVEATTHYNDAKILAQVSRGFGVAMSGLSTASLRPEDLLETRGW